MNFGPIPWIALVLSLGVTLIFWLVILDLENESQQIEFNGFTEKTTLQIKEQLETHEQVLLGFEGLFLASEEVTPKEFSEFFKVQEISERYPEIQGLSYNQYLLGEKEKDELLEKMQAYGIDYSIYPEGSRSTYAPVVYLEPQDERNKQAIGFDIYSDDLRRQAADLAIQSDAITMTEKLTLVQEIDEKKQNGVLLLMPLYKNNEENNSQLDGFLVLVIRMDDFVEGILGVKIFESIEIKIYDKVKNEQSRLFSSHYVKANPERQIFESTQELEFGQRVWIISYLGEIPDQQTIQDNKLVIPFIGISMSFLLFYTLLLLSKTVKLTKTIIIKERTSALGELAARFSHDIRNPMSNIQLALGILKKKQTFASGDAKEKLQIIEKNLNRISHQVEDVLDFVRVHPLQKKMYNLKSLLNETLESVNIPENIKTIIQVNNVSVFGDSDQLQIVFRNLLINSIQELQGKGEIKIKAQQDLAKTIIEFIDSGHGFSGIDKDEIFKLLSTTKQTGTGLGLVTCKSIIENHGGTIDVKEHPTTFTLKLPRR
ncbi:MAG: GHKL domain-containing protein [Nitrosopumilaceae archaeon]|nr:GHKL domain-containing protein [Nitrosopumilaceae archaeon]NIP09972.1 GHKL domain-containing protein [Nitrosopumilaceae archaeon]NIS94743.1 GHKL domain-containing protein [Nitrosopumilaceae archaeon]